MPDIKLRDGSGVEQTYTGVDTITVPLADGSGTWTYGLTDEDLTFRNGYMLFNESSEKILEKFISRIKIDNYNNDSVYSKQCAQLVSNSNLEDLSELVIDCTGAQIFNGYNMFNGNQNLKKLPVIINNENTSIMAYTLFINANNQLTEDEILKFLSGFKKSTNNDGKGSAYGNCSCTPYSGYLDNCLDLSEVNKKWHDIINNEESYHNYSSNPSYSLDSASYTKSIKNVPIQYTNTREVTSSFRIIPNTNFYFSDSFEFATNNGTPYTIKWKSQTLEIGSNYSFGYYDGSYNVEYNRYARGYWKIENNIFNSNNMTIEEAQARYTALKGHDNWYSRSNKQVNYDSKNVYLALLFSRYNHDSAVRTINSLPDTSAYLATAGGTNTIKFKKYMGDLTDGGGISNLTEQEIAVAAAKGWTVSIVN